MLSCSLKVFVPSIMILKRIIAQEGISVNQVFETSVKINRKMLYQIDKMVEEC